MQPNWPLACRHGVTWRRNSILNTLKTKWPPADTWYRAFRAIFWTNKKQIGWKQTRVRPANEQSEP
jgi:hypothetical protein